MTANHFQLLPFGSGILEEKCSLSGSLVRKPAGLLFQIILQGPLDQILLPEIEPEATRCHEIWRHTCFELFLSQQGEDGYWEINLSPSGCWNVYHFAGYRLGMQEEKAVQAPSFHVISNSDLLSLHCSINLDCIIDSSSELLCGVSSVIEAREGTISYWALEHCKKQPDFHDRQGFQMML